MDKYTNINDAKIYSQSIVSKIRDELDKIKFADSSKNENYDMLKDNSKLFSKELYELLHKSFDKDSRIYEAIVL
jgi:arginine repressor